MKHTHYHVLVGLRGCYMPAQNHFCETKVEARDCAADLIRDERDFIATEKTFGEDSIDHGRVEIISRGELWYVPMGRSISISPCSDPECGEEDF